MGIFGRLKAALSGAPAPVGEVVAERQITRLSSQGRQPVSGEQHHADALRRVVDGRRVAPVGQWDAGLRVSAYLVREPKNRHDRNAVMVQVASGGSRELVGYLPSDDAVRWQPLLQHLEAQGRVAECPAMIYRAPQGGYQVVLHLSDPEDALFNNPVPDGAHILDAERQCAVSGEVDHQDVLAQYADGLVWATLHPAVVQGGKFAGQPTIEVRLDGAPVGVLTAGQGQRYAEVLRAAPLVACEARIFTGSRYREVQLMLPKTD